MDNKGLPMKNEILKKYFVLPTFMFLQGFLRIF